MNSLRYHGAMPSALNPGVQKREVFAWSMYDFANSGYTTVVLTTLFNAYFVGVVAGNAPWATFAWTVVTSISYLAVMIAGPVIGAFADAKAAKKRILFVATVGCIVPTAMLYGAGPGMLVFAAICIVISNFSYAIGENLTAAFLPELARTESLGKVSGWGWSLGYVGGLVALLLSLAWVSIAETRGVSGGDAVPATMILTAAVYTIGASFTFLLLRERATPVARHYRWIDTISSLRSTAREAAKFRDLLLVFACGTCYQAGVATVITLASIYAQKVMGFGVKDTIVLVLIVNVTACIGAFAFGYVQDAIGKKRALMLTLVGWTGMVVMAWFATTRPLFWIAANLAGLCMGSSQSAGRALVAFFSPPEKAAEMFGLFGVATRLAAVLGPLTYGTVSWVTNNNHRLAMLVTGVFFIAAIAVLAQVNEARGRAAAEAK